jgi:photosystem II stability/assembly factor-like uncharacterized protein
MDRPVERRKPEREHNVRKRALVGVCGLLVTVAFAAPAQAQVANGQSGWQWGTPTPQGNAINDIGFIGGVGYAVGNFGTIMSTTDAGQTWTGLNTGITADINKVALPAPGTIIIGGGCYDLISPNGGVSFTQMQFTVPGPNCSPTVTSQSFVTPSLGFVLANTGQVLVTNDAGVTFSGNSAPVPGTQAAGGGATATDIAFTSATNGVALVGGSIFRTTNGAGSWTSVHNGGQALNSLFFVNSSTGFAAGANSTVLKTTDGGASWTSVPVSGAGGPYNFLKVRCVDTTRCLFVPANSTGLVRTDNGGNTGAFISFGSTPINAAAFASANQAVAGASDGAMFTSSDGGNTWSRVGSSLVRKLTGLRAVNASFAFAWGNLGAIVTTPNGGVTWTPSTIPSSNGVLEASFADQNNGFALDSGSTLWGTTNGGSTWARKNTGGGRGPNDVAAISGNVVVLIGPRGVRRSTNGGASFSAVSGKPVATARLAQGDVVSNGVVAFGRRALLYSANGASWKAMDLPPSGKKNLAINTADCSSTKVCWALASNEHLFRTTNAGKSWTDVTAATGANDISDAEISFDSASAGYVATEKFAPVSSNLGSTLGANGQGWVLATTDGGKSFAPELIDANPLVAVAAAGATDWALTDGQNLFLTSTNGAQGQASSLTLSASPKTIKKKTTVTLTATLSPCTGNEQILLSGPGLGGGGQIAAITANCTVQVQTKVSKTSSYVTQWAGEAGINGDGSRVITATKK